MMNKVVEEGTGKKAMLEGIKAAGKTGTTNAYRDAWFVGFTGNLVAGVWYGNDDHTSMNNMTGGTLPALTWHEVMAFAHQNLEIRPIPGLGPRPVPPWPSLRPAPPPPRTPAGHRIGRSRHPFAPLPRGCRRDQRPVPEAEPAGSGIDPEGRAPHDRRLGRPTGGDALTRGEIEVLITAFCDCNGLKIEADRWARAAPARRPEDRLSRIRELHRVLPAFQT